MHFHFVSFALQAFRKQKMYMAITVIGLALALGASLLILSFVNHELSFEKCHENAHRIYRIGGIRTDGDVTFFLTKTMCPLGPELHDVLPEVAEQVRFRRFEDVMVKTDRNREFSESKFLLADPEVFSVFTIPLIQGDPQSVLRRPLSVVISERMSRDLFTGRDPVGQSITINDSVTLTVTGVMADLPPTTRIHTNFLASLSTLEHMGEDLQAWNRIRTSAAYTFVLLGEGTNPEAVDAQLPVVLAAHLGEEAATYKLHLQPLDDLYFNSKLSDELGPTGSLSDVYLFAGISLLLVLMACFNYINLSASRIYHRHREIIVRSTAGANRRQLFLQFLTESILLTSIAMFLGLAIYEMFVPHLEAYVGKSLEIGLADNVFVWLAAPILVFIVGVISGSYPAVLMLRLQSKGILTGRLHAGSGKSKLRRTLVIFQACVAIGLIGFTAGIQRQLNFVEAYDHGFEPDNVWLLEFDEDATQDQKERLKRELQGAGVGEMTLAVNAPGESVFRGMTAYPAGRDKRETKFFGAYTGDADYGSTFGLQLVRGRWLSDETVAGMPGAALISESAAELLGLDDPIGSELSSSHGSLRVVGIIKDFLALSLHNDIMPSIITRSSTSGRVLAVRIPEDERTIMMQKMQEIWIGVFPAAKFDCRPLTGVMDDFYLDEQKLITLFSVSSVLSIIIACLGLLGLVSFMVERRTKEIGIRKSIGASVTSVIKLLTGEFIVLVAVAGLIAWPFTRYAMTRWLENFVYRVDYGWTAYAPVVIMVLVVSLCTVGIQIIKTARANPVDTLRHE